MTDSDPNRSNARPLQIGAVVVVVVALLGFLVGTGSSPDLPTLPDRETVPDPNELSLLLPAPTYEGLQTVETGLNRFWSSDFRQLHEALPDPTDPLVVTDEERDHALEEHMANRAYDGAPPTIPHPINDSRTPECMACHGDGLVVEGRIARPPSHELYPNCTQCHVLTEQTFGGRPSEGALEHAQQVGGANHFGGHTWPREGGRAWAGAPPTIPHPTWMRQECASCHGVTGRPGLRIDHAERQNCQQCHAADSALDVRGTWTPTLFALPRGPQ